ncbi:hypothetical protein [Tenacibaculum sp. 190524A02b]|uniref:hypothetical protein n=1 Tax=Tenacibaculum vairaonense TaxID=3137860 RepID=UPI0031FA9991
MKTVIKVYLFLFSSIVFSQTEITKQFKPAFKEIEVNTFGIDDLVIEASENDFITVFLLDEHSNTHIVNVEEINNKTEITFKINPIIYKESNTVFRKFITKRLERARVLIKIPKNKLVTVYGENVGVTSRSYEGTLNIFINKGNIDLQKVSGNTFVSVFQGNIKAEVKKTRLNLETKKGAIKINKKKVSTPYITTDNIKQELKIVSILGNINIVR